MSGYPRTVLSSAFLVLHQGRRFEVPTASAANSFRNFKWKSGTRNHILASAPIPKFVSERAAMYHELRKRGTSALAPWGDMASGDLSPAGKALSIVPEGAIL